MLLEVPRPIVDEADDPDPGGKRALVTTLPPPSLQLVAAGQEGCPRLAHEIGDEDDESARDGDQGGFKLTKQSATWPPPSASGQATNRVNLVHDSLEA